MYADRLSCAAAAPRYEREHEFCYWRRSCRAAITVLLFFALVPWSLQMKVCGDSDGTKGAKCAAPLLHVQRTIEHLAASLEFGLERDEQREDTQHFTAGVPHTLHIELYRSERPSEGMAEKALNSETRAQQLCFSTRRVKLTTVLCQLNRLHNHDGDIHTHADSSRKHGLTDS